MMLEVDGEGRTRLPPAVRRALGLKRGDHGVPIEAMIRRWERESTEENEE